MTGRVAATALAALLAGAAWGQGFEVSGTVTDGLRPPAFSDPTVTVTVIDVRNANSQSFDSDLGRPIPTTLDNDIYRFHDPQLGSLQIAGRTAYFVAEAPGDYESRVAKIYLDAAVAGVRPIEVNLKMRKRSVIAESLRDDVRGLLNKDRPTESDFRDAIATARSAVEMDPRLDNYLLVIKATRAAVHKGGLIDPMFVLSREDLKNLEGFSDLPVEQRWLAETELLEMLAGAPDPQAQLSVSQTFAQAAAALAEQMLDDVADDQRLLHDLGVIRIFSTLNVLHTRNEDCPSVVANSRQAIALATPLDMTWGSQRSFLSDWGFCLEKMSGIGDGNTRTQDQTIADIAAQPAMQAGWTVFGNALEQSRANFEFSGNDTDTRLKSFLETAVQIRGQ